MELTEQQIIEIADQSGLVYSGKNENGELEFIGTDVKWKDFDKARIKKEYGQYGDEDDVLGVGDEKMRDEEDLANAEQKEAQDKAKY